MQKQICVNVDKVPGAVLDGAAEDKRAAAAKANKSKKVTVKPKPKEVIVVSPDTAEILEPKVDEQEKPVDGKKEGEGSSRKKVQTLTSVLTARSKVISFFFF